MSLVTCYLNAKGIPLTNVSQDGTSDPLNATKVTYDLINDLDGGGYHPVSLVLNCQDYFFADYSLGADILMQDTCSCLRNIFFAINIHFKLKIQSISMPHFQEYGTDRVRREL